MKSAKFRDGTMNRTKVMSKNVGFFLCQPCTISIIYSETRKEVNSGVKSGMVCGIVIRRAQNNKFKKLRIC